jgi:hypothetical protein
MDVGEGTTIGVLEVSDPRYLKTYETTFAHDSVFSVCLTF